MAGRLSRHSSTLHALSSLFLIGSETDRDAHDALGVVDIVKSVNIAARIHWLGNRADVPDLLRAFDVFAYPSCGDPCPLSVIEALLAGLPCVVWRDGGTAELVVDGETGVLVEKGNIGWLAAAIRTLSENSKLREQMGIDALADPTRLQDAQTAARSLRKALGDVASLR